MDTYTSLADQLYKEAENVDHSTAPFASCYETLFEQENLWRQARDMEVSAREIRNQFQEIANSGVALPTSSLLRKAIVSVKRGKEMFSTGQVSKVVALLMKKAPYILFRPTSATKDYVVLLFWATSIDDSACEIQRNAEVIKKEIAVDNFQLRFVVENVSSAKKQFLYLLNSYVHMTVQNDSACQLPPEEEQQLNVFLQLLKGSESKKRKLDIAT